MKRWHEEYNISLRECRKRCVLLDNKFPELVNEIGRFRKKDAYDCGNSHCGVCHCDKFAGKKRHRTKHEQEILSELSFKEQLKDRE